MHGGNATIVTKIFDLRVRGLGVVGWGQAFFVLGFWATAFCHGCFVPRFIQPHCNKKQSRLRPAFHEELLSPIYRNKLLAESSPDVEVYW